MQKHHACRLLSIAAACWSSVRFAICFMRQVPCPPGLQQQSPNSQAPFHITTCTTPYTATRTRNAKNKSPT
ncbi:hypothetical protein BDA96_01G231800 [Sorghum bicolor]|uniref:Secreted protein n=2 Tax=Sorghum bicolor TaxID=4558 RepID=A0A921UZ17_SORBI|nr:hypothetical protein BDA96_01G231800 [Sorghum bicolor]KXG38317.1 hypothetical protein SORBI_3001G217800 [Sorghum bicolor]